MKKRAELQNKLDKSKNVTFPAGTYWIDKPLQLRPGHVVKGAPNHSTVLVIKEGSTGFVGGPGARLDGLAFYGEEQWRSS